MARPSRVPLRNGDLHDRLLDAALRVLAEGGAAALTVRGIADAAGTSTIGIYTHFGGRAGLLEVLYRRGFERLRAALIAVPAGDALDRVRNLLAAYRRFAL